MVQIKVLYKEKKERNEIKMKNMKKTILGVAISIIALIMMMGSVNAASISAVNEVEKDKTVTVTVNVDSAKAIEFNVKYNKDKFEFVNAETTLGAPTVTPKDGVVYFATFGTTPTDTVKLNFKATGLTDGETFTLNDLITDVTSDKVENGTVTVKVTEPAKEDDNKEEQNKPQEGQNTQTSNTTEQKDETGTKNTNKTNTTKVSTNGEKITKLQQTGTPVFAIIGAFVVVAGIVFIIKKAK